MLNVSKEEIESMRTHYVSINGTFYNVPVDKAAQLYRDLHLVLQLDAACSHAVIGFTFYVQNSIASKHYGSQSLSVSFTGFMTKKTNQTVVELLNILSNSLDNNDSVIAF